MTRPYRAALLGFSSFERGALASYFRLAARRTPSYELVDTPDEADFLVADADDPAAVGLISALERMTEAVFIGAAAPAGASAWMKRPIEPLHVLRELDAMVLQAAATRPAPHEGAPAIAIAIAPMRAAAPTSTRAAALPTGHPALPAPTALLVDDSEIALHYLRGRLERFGLRVECTQTSDQAIEWLSRRGFELVFIDVELGPHSTMDGLALCQHIKRHHHPVTGGPSSVVMVSAHHSELDRVRGTLAGCDAYLGKPLAEPELARVMQRHGLKPLLAVAS